MPSRTIKAVGTVNNTGDGTTTYNVKLLYTVSDEEGTVVVGPNKTVAQSVSVAKGGTSPTLTIQGSEVVGGGWFIDARVVIDITSPVTIPNAYYGALKSYQEPFSYSGDWTGGLPTITMPFDVALGIAQGEVVGEPSLNPWIPIGIVTGLGLVFLWTAAKK